MYCLIIGIANACKYKNGKSTKKLIEMDFIQNGGNYNFKSLKLTFPKLNEVFDCVTKHGDLVVVEVLFKNAEGAFESIGEYQSYTQGITVFENHRKSLIQHCERSELRLHFEWTKVN